jgi:hypothetical protein
MERGVEREMLHEEEGRKEGRDGDRNLEVEAYGGGTVRVSGPQRVSEEPNNTGAPR